MSEFQNTRNYKVLKMAASQIGVYEWKKGSNPVVEEYLDHGASVSNKDSGLSDAIPWCAGFVAWCLEQVGMQSTNSLMARSYEKWGISSLDSPLPGDIIVFWRNKKSSGSGHVGFFLGYSKGREVLVLGGNQNDSVNVTAYGYNRITDIRRSSKAGKYNPMEIREILALASQIIGGEKIEPPGSMV